MKKLIALLLLSPLAFAEDWNYLICKPKSLLGNSHSYEFNAFIILLYLTVRNKK